MVTKILGAVAILIAIAIVGGSVVAFATGKARPGASLRTIETPPQNENAPTTKPSKTIPKPSQNIPSSSSLATFTGIKQIRALTKANPQDENDIGTPVVITPWFTYPKDDTAFHEELARKSGTMSSIIVGYFADRTEAELLDSGERGVKNDLLDLINTQLVLGKINEIYFTDYLFLK